MFLGTILILFIIASTIIIPSVRVVQEYERGVVFFLGRFAGVRGPGLILLLPYVERMTTVGLRTVTMEIPSQKIITKDNVSIDIAALLTIKWLTPKML
jgi:regulator of protease activity HflC (stomatin/prohibitin superfamily)